jgi:RNA polymerase sigma-70 factor (ECF subfamily)
MDVVRTDGYVNSEGMPTFDYVDEDADVVEQKELHEQIMSAFATLKDRERQVMTMFYFENRKQEEIAELLNLSVSNVKLIMFRTKDKLKSLLKGAYSYMG